MTKRNNFKFKLILGIFCSAAIIATLLFFLFIFPKEMRTDYKRLSDENYDTVFLSMYPIDNYEEESYTYWRGMNAVVTAY